MSINLSLDRVRALSSHLTYTRPTCHIAGTNGKGSVSAILHSIFRSATPPLNVGRYNSPHLVSVHDCIVINDSQVSIEEYDSARNLVEQTDKKHNIGASSFELLTLTAFVVFERAHVDIAIIEVGMGGRLDATNIIRDEYILVSALTAVDLDHQSFLGSTVSTIAVEKASIARKGQPFIICPQKHADALETTKRIVNQIGGNVVDELPVLEESDPQVMDSSSLHVSTRSLRISMSCFTEEVYTTFNLQGEHQLDNLSGALAVVSSVLTDPGCIQTLDLRSSITPQSVAEGIKKASWPGRLSYHSVYLQKSGQANPLRVLVDGAHNAASSASLAQYLSSIGYGTGHSRTLTYILALSRSPPKTPLETLSPLLERTSGDEMGVACVPFSPPDGMPWVKPVPPIEVMEVAHTIVPRAEMMARPSMEREASADLLDALEWAASRTEGKPDGLIVIAGSLYLVADFYRLMKDGRLTLTP